MRRTPLLGAAVVLCLTFGAAACGGSDDDGDDPRAEMVDELTATLQDIDNGLDDAQAECVAESIVDEIGVEALKDVDLSAEVPPEDLQEDLVQAQVVAAEKCDLPDPSG